MVDCKKLQPTPCVIRGLKLYCSGRILPVRFGDLGVSRNGDDNKLVFVSCAHADEDCLKKKLMLFLRQLKIGEQIELWHDQLISTGKD